MPTIYLSPSLRDSIPFMIGGTEESYMNQIADDMIPHLRASNIGFTRSDPGNTVAKVIEQSNAGSYDLHLVLHSNSSPDNMRGVLQGPDVYFYPTSEHGRRAAALIAANLKNIYPAPSLVSTIPTTTVAELRKTKAPAVLVEIAYRDNFADATWLRDNIESIGKNLVQSIAQYLGVPYMEP